ncbi:MAG TPA: hypothetical protein VJK02_04280 [Anaerolineales bacterium]|nr:hypothetical protein [Anaerolineales bacterium]
MNRSVRALVIGLALILVLVLGAGLVVSSSWGRGYGWGMMGPGMMGPGMMGGWWGFGLLGPIVLLVLGVLIIGGVVWFVQALARGGDRRQDGQMAEPRLLWTSSSAGTPPVRLPKNSSRK